MKNTFIFFLKDRRRINAWGYEDNRPEPRHPAPSDKEQVWDNFPRYPQVVNESSVAIGILCKTFGVMHRVFPALPTRCTLTAIQSALSDSESFGSSVGLGFDLESPFHRRA